jgi:hypothetical protein
MREGHVRSPQDLDRTGRATMDCQSQRREGSIKKCRKRASQAKHKKKRRKEQHTYIVQGAIGGGRAFDPIKDCTICKAKQKAGARLGCRNGPITSGAPLTVALGACWRERSKQKGLLCATWRLATPLLKILEGLGPRRKKKKMLCFATSEPKTTTKRS